MFISLRFKILAAFSVMALVLGWVSVMSISALEQQTRTALEAASRQDQAGAAMATLRALPFETEGLVLGHLHARTATEKGAIAADLLAADTQEALALSSLTRLSQGAEAALIADLALQARQAADLRDRLMAISARNALGEAAVLATQQMPDLRAQIIEALQIVAVQSGDPLPSAQAEAALNAIAAAQKNAVLQPEPGFLTDQLAAAELARNKLTAALAVMAVRPVAGTAPLQALIRDLQKLDDRIEVLLRDGGTDTAETIYQTQLRPLDRQRLEALEGLAQLMQTGRRAAAAEAEAKAAQWGKTLILLVNFALVIGCVAVILGLSRIGRGLEAAVRLAERMAGEEVAAPTKVKGNLAGRLTAALVRVSAGQSAVLSSLEALAAGRQPHHDLPEKVLLRLDALRARGGSGDPADLQSAQRLQDTLRSAVQDAQLMQEETGKLASALTLTSRRGTLAEEAERLSLVAERQMATLILADRQAGELTQGMSQRMPALRRIA